MPSIFCGTAYHELHEEGARFLAAHREGEVLVVGASRGAAEDFARSVSGSGSLGVHTVTLTQVVTTLAAEEVAARGLTPISKLRKTPTSPTVKEMRALKMMRLKTSRPLLSAPKR